MNYVYILYSESLNSFYKGQTENIANRFHQQDSLSDLQIFQIISRYNLVHTIS
jgi:predicted GIY-YIG superfamily endonuclease